MQRIAQSTCMESRLLKNKEILDKIKNCQGVRANKQKLPLRIARLVQEIFEALTVEWLRRTT